MKVKENSKRTFLCDITGMCFDYSLVLLYIDGSYHVNFFDDEHDKEEKMQLLEQAFSIRIISSN